MSRLRTLYRCAECGNAAARWAGRCGTCGEWNTLVEEVEAPRARSHLLTTAVTGLAPSNRPVPIADVDATHVGAVPTGLGELDRVLSGGVVPGSVTLIGGEPGIGKSTLLLQALASSTFGGRRGLLVSAEESAQQVRLRAERLGALQPSLYLLAETVLPHILAAIDQLQPDVVVIDSIQSVYDPGLDSGPGSVTQVRECAAQLVRMAKGRIQAVSPEGVGHVEDQVETGRGPGLAVLLVGHVTKEGSLAGPRVLEHVVDTVLAFEGDRHHALRLLRAVKHRFGSTTELGVFEMAGSGLREVADPSALFLGDRRAGVAGSAIVSTIDGHRPLLVEIQALVAPPTAAVPRRGVQGLDPNRLPLLLAVLERRCHLRLTGADVYASAVGGVRLTEPGVDLALGLALASSHSGVALPRHLVACGEVGLGGELRQVPHTNRRLAEAVRLGFRHALVPASAPDPPPGLALTRVVTLAEALEALGLAPSSIYGLVSGHSHLDSERAHPPKRGDDRCVGSGGPGPPPTGGT